MRRLISAFFLTTCTAVPPAEPVVEHVHPNGLTLRLPASLSVQEMPGGFLVDIEARRRSRYPLNVEVVRHEGANSPDGNWPTTRVVRGRTCAYRQTHGSGGSGGDEIFLDAWCPYPGGYVQIDHAAQSEWPPEPSDEFGWQVLAGLVDPR